MKRKLLAVILIVCLSLAVFSGCGKDEGNQNSQANGDGGTMNTSDFTGEDPQLEKHIKILSIWAEDNDNGILINNILQRYKDQVNPNFSYEYELVSADDLKTKIATLASSNDLPDFFAYESGTPLKEMVEADKVLNIGAELERVGAMDMMNPSQCPY